MKKILASVIVAALFFLPSVSSAKSTISDNDLGAIVAQSGSVTITFDDIKVKSRDLRTTSTDGLDFWNPAWDRDNLVCNGDLCHADYFLEAAPTSHNSDYENNMPLGTAFDAKGYVGYADVRITGGIVRRSGTMTMEVVSTDDPNVLSQCKLNVTINHQMIDANIGIEAAIKLGTTSDLSGNQYLGRTYTAGVSATTNGSLTVYAHNNSLF